MASALTTLASPTRMPTSTSAMAIFSGRALPATTA